MKVLLLGGSGIVGRRVAQELVQRSEVQELVIASRNRGGAEQTVRAIDAPGISLRSAHVDATDPAQVTACSEGADVAVSCAGPFIARDFPAAQGAIDAGVAYVSLGDDLTGTRQVLELNERAIGKGVTVVTGCGFSPGITGLLVALAARSTTVVEDVEISVAISLLDARGRATALHFLSALGRPAGMVFDHRFVEEGPGASPKLVYFPPPMGWVETFRCAHPEVISLLASYPTVRSLQCRIGLPERVAMDLARVGARLGVARSEWVAGSMLRMGAPARPLLERIPPQGAHSTAIRVDVRGHEEGRAVSYAFGISDRFAKLAALPLVQAAIELGRDRARRPGVHSPDVVFAAGSFLEVLVQRGLRIVRLEPATL